MTDEILDMDGKPAAAPEQFIETDASGDPIRQGTLMLEKESYERVIEGLRMTSDACAHLIRHEPLKADYWRGFMTRMDQARRICVQYAGLGLVMQQNQTAELRGEPLASNRPPAVVGNSLPATAAICGGRRWRLPWMISRASCTRCAAPPSRTRCARRRR
jgi:hypothetical protein